jgi:hypothetical protein
MKFPKCFSMTSSFVENIFAARKYLFQFGEEEKLEGISRRVICLYSGVAEVWDGMSLSFLEKFFVKLT